MKTESLRLSVVPVSGSLYHSEGLGCSIQQVIIFSHRHYLSIFYKRLKIETWVTKNQNKKNKAFQQWMLPLQNYTCMSPDVTKI